MESISVTELNNIIKSVLDLSLAKNIAVFGEVSGVSTKAGHAYFTLKDKDSSLQCNCFSYSRTYLPKDGESIIAYGAVDYWTKGGRLNFNVKTIEPAGKGLLFLEFERLKARLSAEGLFEAAHKIPIPKYCKNMLVITSKEGAVIRDIVTTVRRKNPLIDIVVKDVRVQGAQAVKDIVSALTAADKLGYDVIVVARGGGSLEDLAPFYDEGIVRAVYAMSTPVVSAVGHETDFSLCDFAADARAATPTAAAELVAYDYYELRRKIIDSMRRIKTLTDYALNSRVSAFKLAGRQLGSRLTERLQRSQSRIKMLKLRAETALNKNADLKGKAARLNVTATRMTETLKKNVSEKEHALSKLNTALDNLNPARILSSGYFRLTDGLGVDIKGVKGLKPGDGIVAVGHDGRAEATVNKVKKGVENPR
ncbi:MAG: exodeoxyribonuclease VII large subunit [Clostridiaceae bacterium]|jgi:exodeoxyribonuclease VII large subunit|nr:exodeoxyribonuclease VII large subunit [Clostridiaceae bacterium]